MVPTTKAARLGADWGPHTRRNLKNGLLFISPWVAGFLMFTLFPFAASIYYSLTRYDILNPAVWIGPGNYVKLFTDDPLFWVSLYNTLYYTLLSVPLGIMISLVLAIILNTGLRGMALYRTMFYLPSVVPIVATSIVWMWLLNPRFGLVNNLLEMVGIAGPNWLNSTVWSKPALILMSIWGIGPTVVICLAGLQEVPQEFYEAASIDGATWWHRVRYVTLPLITPIIFYTLIMNLISAFQVFTPAYIMTGGGPLDSTLFYNLLLYQNAFQYFKMGYGSAMAWILFILIITFTLLLVKSSGRWVYYAGQ